MDNQPIRDERILEAVESCRPGSADVAEPALAYLAAAMAADPELKQLYERLQRVDATLGTRFRDVPVPKGLERRLVNRLAAARPEPALGREEEGPEETPSVIPTRPKWVSRRWLLAGGGALTAAAGLLIAVLIGARGSQDYTESEILVEAIKAFNAEPPPPERAYVDAPSPRAYPLSNDIVRLDGTRWRKIHDFLGRQGVAYDLPGPGRTRATLYVVKGRVAGLPRRAPLVPSHTTAGCCSSAWQAGELLYVLVIKHGNYRDYVPPGTIV